MLYLQKGPIIQLSRFVRKFWLIDSDGQTVVQRQKIVPDGYPEIIFHYKEPYRININGGWEEQSKYLVAGQIRKHFYLENTGHSGMFGIKFQPWALRILFGFDMHKLTDKVIPVDLDCFEFFKDFKKVLELSSSFEEKINAVQNLLLKFIATSKFTYSSGEEAVKIILKHKGAVNFKDICKSKEISQRGLERYFKNHIGLNPKFYSRIIRFSHIFHLFKKHQKDWLDISYYAGYYDQSHFIRNFKEFTGEEPSKYGFSKKNMGNFFFKD